MSHSLDKMIQATADWRRTIRTNNRRTFFVISLFFLIYIALGLLVDTYIYAGQFSQAPLGQIFYAIITFHLMPWATFVMIGVAGISLLITFTFSDKLMLLGTEYKKVDETATDPREKQLYNIVEEMKIAAGLRYTPKVYIIDANYMNAFASGYSEKSAMIAVTSGLLQKLNRDELTAVIAHELSHIRHMDIKLTLMASVLANLMIIVLDIFFYNAMFSSRRDSDRRNALAGIIILLRYLLPLINILLLLYLSRTREYMADAGSVELLRDNKPLASALVKIYDDTHDHQAQYSESYKDTAHENVRREAYIFDPSQAGVKPMASLTDIFSTHPNIKDRLAAIGFKYDHL